MFALCIGGGVGFYDGFFDWYGLDFTVCFVALGHFSLVDATARTKILNFTSNIAALLFFVLAGLPVWEIGLMAVGGFIGAQLGAKWWLPKVKVDSTSSDYHVYADGNKTSLATTSAMASNTVLIR